MNKVKTLMNKVHSQFKSWYDAELLLSALQFLSDKQGCWLIQEDVCFLLEFFGSEFRRQLPLFIFFSVFKAAVYVFDCLRFAACFFFLTLSRAVAVQILRHS